MKSNLSQNHWISLTDSHRCIQKIFPFFVPYIEDIIITVTMIDDDDDDKDEFRQGWTAAAETSSHSGVGLHKKMTGGSAPQVNFFKYRVSHFIQLIILPNIK